MTVDLTNWEIRKSGTQIFTGSFDQCMVYAIKNKFRVILVMYPDNIINVSNDFYTSMSKED